ncbi:MAG: hypothetical protein ABJB47_08315 [Actinomycetota bacterium]
MLVVPDVSAVLDACLGQGYEVTAAADSWVILRAARPAAATGVWTASWSPRPGQE